MAEIVSVRLGEEIEKGLILVEKEWSADRSEIIRRLLSKALLDWKIEHSMELYKKGKITLMRAAEMCSLSLWEMIDIVRERKIAMRYTSEDLEKDLEIAKELSKKIK